MGRMLAIAVLLAVGGAAPAFAVSETEEGFAAAMQGCWTQTRWGEKVEEMRRDPEFTIAAQICLDGGVSGVIEGFYCDGRPVIDCWDSRGTYAFKDKKFWRHFAGGMPAGHAVSCDVRLVPGKQVELYGCIGHAEDGTALEPVDGGIYEKRTGQ
jgi:hypothetical protein